MKRSTRLAVLLLAAAPPPRNGAAAPGNAAAPAPATPEAGAPTAPQPPRPPLATRPTDWPGVEARLSSAKAAGGLLLVEVQLANTGSAPASIENYSAAAAEMHDDVSTDLYGVFTPPGGQPAATAGLTQTLQPGETTTINMTFPLSSKAQLVSIMIPSVGLFEAVPLQPKGNTSGAPATTGGRRRPGDPLPARKP